MAALVPKHRTAKDRPVTQDEKNIRWAVNKYVYSRKKNSLSTAYKLMLKEKYTDSSGKLLEKYPSFNQFRYWYSKNKKYKVQGSASCRIFYHTVNPKILLFTGKKKSCL